VAAGERVAVMKNKVVRRLAVSSIARLGLGVALGSCVHAGVEYWIRFA
jgi:hypothetical protein